MDCGLPGSSVRGIPRQGSWSGLPFPSPGDLPDPGIELTSPALAGGFFTREPLGKPLKLFVSFSKYSRNTVVVVTVDVNDIEAEFAIVVKGSGHSHGRVS